MTVSCSKQLQVRKELLVTEHISGFGNALQAHSDGDFSKDEVGLGMLIYYHLWVNKFGDQNDEIFETFNNLTIIWMPSQWTIYSYAYDKEGNALGGPDGLAIVGLARQDHTILLSKESGNLWDTSLAHELTHVALYTSTGVSDADHLGDKIPGWTEEHMKVIALTNLLLEHLLAEKELTEEQLKELESRL
jgi:hypothetical protein